MVNFFFGGWEPVLRVAVVGIFAYVAVVAFLRIGGNRSLAQTHAFDFIVTVALGATLGSVLTARSVSVLEAVMAFGILIGLQFVVTTLQVRSRAFVSLIAQSPVLLAEDGRALEDALFDHRITPEELHIALRKSGFGSLVGVAAVVLEADGNLSVIGSGDAGDRSALSALTSRSGTGRDGTP